MEFKNYYKILGVPRTADAAQIKSAYRKLAHQLHPDLNGGSKASEARFKEINEANTVLSDAGRRSEYDALGPDGTAGRRSPDPFGRQSRPASGGDPFGPRSRPVDPFGAPGATRVRYQFSGDQEDFSDFFRVFFGGQGDLFGEQADPFARQSRPSRPDEPAVRPSPPPRPTPRPAEFRSPAPGPKPRNRSITVSLPEADRGAAKVVIISGRRLEVNIPAGVDSGSKIRLAGAGPDSSDVMLVVKLAPHPVFTRSGPDLTCEVPVTLAEALLGGEVEVSSLRNRLTLKIPAGIRQGQTLRLAGHGMPVLRSQARGDLLVKVKILMPGKLSPQAQRAAAELVALAPQANPRGKG